jgi:hypothetical protein
MYIQYLIVDLDPNTKLITYFRNGGSRLSNLARPSGQHQTSPTHQFAVLFYDDKNPPDLSNIPPTTIQYPLQFSVPFDEHTQEYALKKYAKKIKRANCKGDSWFELEKPCTVQELANLWFDCVKNTEKSLDNTLWSTHKTKNYTSRANLSNILSYCLVSQCSAKTLDDVIPFALNDKKFKNQYGVDATTFNDDNVIDHRFSYTLKSDFERALMHLQKWQKDVNMCDVRNKLVMTSDPPNHILLSWKFEPGNHDQKPGTFIWTPFELINMTLNMLPVEIWSNPSITFFDPFCGRGSFLFAVILRLFDGLSEIIPNEYDRLHHIIRNQVFGMDVSEGQIERCEALGRLISSTPLNVKQGNSLEYNSIRGNWPEVFDVVLGNPPFNGDGTQTGNKLWQRFVELAFTLRNETGFVTLITPEAWRAGFKKKSTHKKAQELIFDHEILSYHDAKAPVNHFKGVKAGINVWLTGSKKNVNRTILHELHLLPIDPAYRELFEGFFTICKNKKACNMIPFIGPARKAKNGRLRDFRNLLIEKDPRDPLRPFRVANSAVQSRENLFGWSDVMPPYYTSPKVIVSDSSGPGAWYDHGSCGLGKHGFAYLVDDEIQGKNLVSFFERPLVDIIAGQVLSGYKHGFPEALFNSLPREVLNCQWSETSWHSDFQSVFGVQI